MGYFRTFGSVVVYLLIHSITDVSCIASKRDVEDHVRISRTQAEEPALVDWEVGLREATHQALLRDGYGNPSLRGYLQSAPFSGKQTVKVFGDIAILARGQLYATPVGFSFVQDPYHNDCDECHNERKCRGDKCDHYVPYGAQQLIALWTVKRIRHRDINFGYRYEVEYTISPVDKALKDGFITKNGKFDYGIPGHVFVIRSNPRYVNGYEHNEFYSSPDQVKWHRQYVPRPQHEIYPKILITHREKPPLTNPHPSLQPSSFPDESNSHNNNLKEIQLYRKLINSLSAKTSTTGHRFKIDAISTPPINRMTPSSSPTTYQITGSPPRTTLVQLPTGQIVPVTEVTTSRTPDGQLQILTPVQVGAVQNGDVQTSRVHFVPSSPITVTEVTKYHTEASIPNQIPSTKIPIFIMKELIPPPTPSVRTEVVKDMGSTKLPKKTTIHFFAAEDIDKSAQEEKDVGDIFTITSRKYASRKESTKPSPQRTTKTYDDEDEDDFNLFPAVKPTEAMRKATDIPFRETSPIDNQISRPYKETATTQSLSSNPQLKKEQEPTFYRRTTTPMSYLSTTETPITYGTQKTTITLPMPGTFDQQTTAYGIQTTPYQRNTESTASYTYNIQSTPEPNETIITVTPVPTIPVGHSSLDESTSYEYTQGRFTTPRLSEYTTGTREIPTDNVLTRTTLVFPSTSRDTTFGVTDTASTQHTDYGGTTNSQTYTESPSTTEIRFNQPSTNTIVTYFGPQTTEFHNFAYPPTETVPVPSTTSPTTEMTTPTFESSKATRLATTKMKTTTPKSSENDFLVEEISDEDDSVQISRNKSKFEDYTDDDIFGPAKPKQSGKKFSNYKRQSSKIYKTSFTTEPTRTVAKTPRIIYSDFYEASTVPPTTSLSQFYAESQNNYITHPMNITTQRTPLTSQSYLTSISYKVNKKKPLIEDEIEVLPTIRAKLSNLLNNEKLQIFRAELPENEENATKKSAEKDAFDNIALQLVNHARGLELLDKKHAMDNKTSLPEKKNSKYRRRTYKPRSRKNYLAKTKDKKEQ
ncbi:mucin-5AC-like [Coccinella septempunctata]|uniref:mucin-5AC-like n=1 Tax=Coccinella septempunctata TaxID=41139 RepID=UPI001D0747BC|nr:mucin-5AC-like [Coccinella septempunctata]